MYKVLDKKRPRGGGLKEEATYFGNYIHVVGDVYRFRGNLNMLWVIYASLGV
jgi:hypothetical protein